MVGAASKRALVNCDGVRDLHTTSLVMLVTLAVELCDLVQQDCVTNVDRL